MDAFIQDQAELREKFDASRNSHKIKSSFNDARSVTNGKGRRSRSIRKPSVQSFIQVADNSMESGRKMAKSRSRQLSHDRSASKASMKSASAANLSVASKRSFLSIRSKKSLRPLK